MLPRWWSIPSSREGEGMPLDPVPPLRVPVSLGPGAGEGHQKLSCLSSLAGPSGAGAFSPLH